MALSVCSDSARRALSSPISFFRSSGFSICLRGMLYRPQIQPDQDPITIGHVANEFAQRQGQALDQRGRRDNLLFPGEHGLLINIDYFERVAAFQMLFTNPFDV